MMTRRTAAHMKRIVGIIFSVLLVMSLYKYSADKAHRSFQVRQQPSFKGRPIRPDGILHWWAKLKSNKKSAVRSHQHNSLKFRHVHLSLLPKRFVCCRPKKAWPINMFIFASSYGIAKRLNRTLIVDAKFLPLFKMKAKKSHVHIIHDMGLCKRYSIHIERAATRFDSRLLDLNLKPRLYLHGYLQSWKYFHGAEQEIRQFFHFNDKLIRSAQHKLQTFKKEYFEGKPVEFVFVGMDIRRKGLKKYLNEYMAPKEYFENAIDFFNSHYTNVVFVACTDSREWVEKHLPDVNVLQVNQASFQMCVLSMCNHTIISPGAFGWWSSWLANGTTTYYRPSRKTQRLHPYKFSSSNEDYYPPNWVAISGDKNK